METFRKRPVKPSKLINKTKNKNFIETGGWQ